MKKYFLALFLSIGFLNAFAQKVDKNDSVQELIKKGIELHDERDYKQAIEAYKEALEIDPNSMLATYELALSYLALRDYDNASKLSKDVINSKDEKLLSAAYRVKSQALVEKGKTDEAIALLENAIKIIKNDYNLHFNLALNYFNKGDLDKTIFHVDNALNLDKFQSGAYLLSAYALSDKDIWVQSILSFQFFLLNEPNSHRSKAAFEEMLQIMHVKETTEEPVERSFIQKQLDRYPNKSRSEKTKQTPPLDTFQGVNRELVYTAIKNKLDSLEATISIDPLIEDTTNTILYNSFKEATRSVFKVLSEENDGAKKGFIWTYHVPVISRILESAHFDTYCRYISVAYFPESLKWWEDNQETAAKFIRWFEKGDEEE